MSKMGTSTLRSYRGAQIFEAIGLGEAVVDKCFAGTASRIGGVGFAELEAEAAARLKQARTAVGPLHPATSSTAGGSSARSTLESRDHLPPPVGHPENDYKKFKVVHRGIGRPQPEATRHPGLIDFASGLAPVPLSEVEPWRRS
jgi:glutamate synthase (NADPH/NADH) large chain